MLARHELGREGGWGRGLELSWFVYERRDHQGSPTSCLLSLGISWPWEGWSPPACESPNMSKHHKM